MNSRKVSLSRKQEVGCIEEKRANRYLKAIETIGTNNQGAYWLLLVLDTGYQGSWAGLG